MYNYATSRRAHVTAPHTRCRLPSMTQTQTEAKPFGGVRVSRPQEKFEVAGRNLQVYRHFAGRTSLSLTEDEPGFSSSVRGEAVADRDNCVCVFSTTKSAQTFYLTINSDANVQSSWNTIKRIELLVDNLSDAEQRRIRDLQYNVFDKLPPTATLFNQGSHWSLECAVPSPVLTQLSTDLVSCGVESVAIKIEWPFGFLDSSSGAWGFFEGSQLRGHVLMFAWLLQTEGSRSQEAPSALRASSVKR
jgi:hypothetical protein